MLSVFSFSTSILPRYHKLIHRYGQNGQAYGASLIVYSQRMLEFHSRDGNGSLDLLHRGYNLLYSFYSLMYDTLCCLAAVEEPSAIHLIIILCPLDVLIHKASTTFS